MKSDNDQRYGIVAETSTKSQHANTSFDFTQLQQYPSTSNTRDPRLVMETLKTRKDTATRVCAHI